MDAEKAAPIVRKLIGPFGEVVAMRHTGVNQLILVGTVGNLKRICKLIDDGQLIIPVPPPDLPRRTDPGFGNDPRFADK